MAIAVVLIVLVLGSVLFYFLSPWTLTPLASNWGSMDDTITITFVVTGIVFVAVNLFLAYAIIRYRYNSKKRSLYEPESKKLEAWLTGLTTIGIAALLAPGLFVWNSFVNVPDDAHEVEVVGQQWHWSYRFPGDDGQFGNVRTRLITEDNPFGLDPDDPRGRDDVLVQHPKLILPVDRPVKLLLRSKDVLHNFQVAQFRAKMDLVPGQVSYMWLTPTRTGRFDVLCAELCGIAHFAMRGMVEVVSQPDFDSWLNEQPTFAQQVALRQGDPIAGQRLYASCMSCHGSRGEGNDTLNAPRIAGIEPWYLNRQLAYFRTGARGAHPDDPYGKMMQPFAAMLTDRSAVADLAAFLRTLSAPTDAPTISGDLRRGERIYRTCAACHGSKGEGIQATNAPRLAGMPDWYLARQLNHFRQGIRGRHDDDLYGAQMAEMAKILTSEQAVSDVIAYINTLAAPPAKGAELTMAGEK